MRQHIAALTVLALLFRSLIPAGFMLSEGQGARTNSVTVTICPGHMAPEPNAQGSRTKPAKSGSHTGLCPYAAVASTADAGAICEALDGPVRYDLVAYREPVHFLIALRESGIASARGPPAV